MFEGKTSRASLLALAAALLIGGGCAMKYHGEQWLPVQPGTREGDVSLYRDVSFVDIPVPVEFILIPAESYSFQGAHFRTGVFRYTGNVEWRSTLEYFRNEMPAQGWNLETTERGWDLRTLTFTKGPERLIVVVRQIRNGTALELQLDNIAQNDLLLKGKLQNS